MAEAGELKNHLQRLRESGSGSDQITRLYGELASSENPRAAPAVIRLLNEEPDASIRTQVATSLGNVSPIDGLNVTAIRILSALARDADGAVAEEASLSIGLHAVSDRFPADASERIVRLSEAERILTNRIAVDSGGTFASDALRGDLERVSAARRRVVGR